MKVFLDGLRRGWEIFRPFRKKFLIVLSMLALVEGLTLTTPYFVGAVVNAAQEHKPMEYALLLATLMFLVSLISASISNRKDIFELMHLDFGIGVHLTNRTLAQILGFSIGQHRSQSSGITQSVVMQGQSALEQTTNLFLYTILPIFARTTVTLILLFFFNKTVGSIVILATTVYVWLALRDNRRSWPQVKKLWDNSHKNRKSYSEIVGNLSVVQVNAQEKRMHKEHSDRLEKWSNEGKAVWIPYQFKASSKHGLTLLTRYVALVIGILMVYKMNYRLGDLLIMMSWTNQATSELWTVNWLQRQLLNQWAQVKKYFALLEVTPAIRVVENPIRPTEIEGKIEFRNVSFTYPDQRYIDIDDDDKESEESTVSKATLPALDEVSFTIQPAETVAFVGESGAGKSTIISMLVRAYDPDEGQVLVDDNDLRLLDLKVYRESIGVVEQKVRLFDRTIRYNMLFSLNGHGQEVTDEELRELAEISRINRFEHRLTDGWDTNIGENGVKLSGGECQRVGIARALVKRPSLLIFDEATSNLDPKNERAIKEAIRNASVGRTTIIIAHRLSTVRDADKIFVMDKGKIVGEGKHDELIRTSSHYRELVSEQLVHL